MVEEALSYWTEIQRFEDMLAADPRSYCFAPLSDLYRKLGLLDDAISVAKKGSELHPDYPGAFFALANAYLQKGLKQEAREAFARVVELSPENLKAQKLLGQLSAEAGDLVQAEKALVQVLLQDPDDTESSLLLRSITSMSPPVEPEEEELEELEIIEELTEVLDEELAAEPELCEAPDLSEEAENAEYDEFYDFHETDAAAGAEPNRAAAAAAASGAHGARDPLTTATLAELYVSQGFLDKAIAIYQELLAADSGQHSYRLRRDELIAQRERLPGAETPPPAAPAAAAAQPQAAFSEPAWDLPFEPPDAGAGEADFGGGNGAKPELPFQPVLESGRVPEPEPLFEPQFESATLEALAASGSAEAELGRWLENIRRRRDGL